MTDERKPEDYDVRVVHYNVRRGRMSHDDVKAFIADLPDEAEHARETETRWATRFQSRLEEGDDASAE